MWKKNIIMLEYLPFYASVVKFYKAAYICLTFVIIIIKLLSKFAAVFWKCYTV